MRLGWTTVNRDIKQTKGANHHNGKGGTAQYMAFPLDK